MDFQQLDELEYLYNTEQISQEEYQKKNKNKRSKQFLFTLSLFDSLLGDEYFNQVMEEIYNDKTEIL